MYDHIYRADAPRPISIFALADEAQSKRVFEVNSLAKSYSYPAIRAGWAVGDEAVMAFIQETKDPMLGPLNNIAQLVTISALKHTRRNYHADGNFIYDERLKLVHEKLRRIKGFKTKMPAGAFYYFADFSGLEITAEEIVKQCAARNIKLSWGAKFGAPDCIRINCGAKPEVLGKICDAIVEICSNK